MCLFSASAREGTRPAERHTLDSPNSEPAEGPSEGTGPVVRTEAVWIIGVTLLAPQPMSAGEIDCSHLPADSKRWLPGQPTRIRSSAPVDPHGIFEPVTSRA